MPERLYNGMGQDVTDNYTLRSNVEETFLNNKKLTTENHKLEDKVKRLEKELKELKANA